MKLTLRYWRGPDAKPLDTADDVPELDDPTARALAAHMITQGIAVCVELRAKGQKDSVGTCTLHPVTRKLVWLP